jgi:hypothetical protein
MATVAKTAFVLRPDGTLGGPMELAEAVDQADDLMGYVLTGITVADFSSRAIDGAVYVPPPGATWPPPGSTATCTRKPAHNGDHRGTLTTPTGATVPNFTWPMASPAGP